jgi:hypothetical protein
VPEHLATLPRATRAAVRRGLAASAHIGRRSTEQSNDERGTDSSKIGNLCIRVSITCTDQSTLSWEDRYA